MEGILYLIPVTLGDTNIEKVLPEFNKKIISAIKYFVVENTRSARRFLKKNDPTVNIDDLTFFELNKHTDINTINSYLQPILQGYNIGLMSEAGCPAIADPGSDIVALAQDTGVQIVPLIGPSSILLSLMASGFNGQSFTFNGYLPIATNDRMKKLKQMEHRISSEHQTQIFIETPYRNEKLIEDIIKNCSQNLKLCIAINITCEDELIQTKTLKNWKKHLPDMTKKTCIFLLYK